MQLKIFDLCEPISLMRGRIEIERELRDVISYLLYREFYTDFGVYSLPNRLLSVYCKNQRTLLTLLRPLGKDIVKLSAYHGRLEIIDDDLWVLLSDKEVLLNGPQIENNQHRRMVVPSDSTRKELLKRAIIEARLSNRV